MAAMRSSSSFYGVCCSLIVVAPSILGASYTNQRVTTAAPPLSGCVVPLPVQSFLTTNNTVYLYFDAEVTSTDALALEWDGPGNAVLPGGNWGQPSGSYCFTGSLTITNTPSNLLGSWQVRVLDNERVLFSVPFSISAPGTTSGSSTVDSPIVTKSQRTLWPPDLTNDAYSAQAQVLIDNSPSQSNPFYEGGAWDCTRYAWGRAVEKLGVRLGFTGGGGNQNAGQWYQNVVLSGDVSLGSTNPRPNSLAVWTEADGNGHVAFVEDITSDGSLIVSEANYPFESLPHETVLAPSQISIRYNGLLVLAGFINLTSYEGYVDSDSNACSTTVSGWVANHDNLNTPLTVDIFDGNTSFLGSAYANAWREDVGTYLKNTGFNAFSYVLPGSVYDGATHNIWVRVDGSYTDLSHTQSITCKNKEANLQVVVVPNYVTPTRTSSCATSFQFSLSATETNGVGISLSKLSISPEGYTYFLPDLGLPGRVNGGGTAITSLVWCRNPGISTFTITGTDDEGNSSSWSSTAATFALQ